jgi:hypothetical protein
MQQQQVVVLRLDEALTWGIQRKLKVVSIPLTGRDPNWHDRLHDQALRLYAGAGGMFGGPRLQRQVGIPLQTRAGARPK